ncbi:unnamed protein product [Closterium sp. Naga37s-1]|nr:unnamed protein product [Closterium sp. Naga37s-1]
MPRARQPNGAVLVRASTSATESSQLFLGFDFGTSGARAVVIDGNATILADVKRKYPPAAHAESASESAVGSRSDPDGDVSAAEGWRAALFGLLRDIPEELRRRVAAVSLDGTSATTMLVSRAVQAGRHVRHHHGRQPCGAGDMVLDGTSATTTMVISCSTREPVARPMMYNEAGSPEAVAAVAAVAPANHTATAATSTLCKLMTWWMRQGGVVGGKGEGSGEEERGGRGGGGGGGEGEGEVVMVHQADWLLGQLCVAADVHVTDFNNALKVRVCGMVAAWGDSADGWDVGGVAAWVIADDELPEQLCGAADVHWEMHHTDFNNALKLGYDPESSAYPDWLLALPLAPMLPRVLPPGSLIGTVGAELTTEFALLSDCIVTTGTTDSIAAFLTARIDDARFGVYSHRLPPGDWAPPGVENEGEAEQGGAAEEDKECKWLVGGASNTGGAVLRGYFTDEQLRELSARIDPSVECKLDYYPLTRPGERFPVSDPDLLPRLTPRPADDALFLHGILESIATIESISTIEVRFYYSLPCARHFLVPLLF